MRRTPVAASKARRQALLDWYHRHQRELPWRHTRDPYRILVSEVMCQQTQAERVIPRYNRFLRRFPDVASLATAAPAEVLEEWSGLGYNRRAIHLHRAARKVVHEGWPCTVEGLRRLPGVGPYTAAAVACFAFGEVVPAVDTNTRRVLSRWSGTPLAGAPLAEAATEELDREEPAGWNQAIMDLGASLCTAQAPACTQCPVTRWCADPSVYQPPRSQGRFEGSSRQARGAVIRELIRYGPQTGVGLGRRAGVAPARLGPALAALVDDGLVVEVDGHFALPGGGAVDGMG